MSKWPPWRRTAPAAPEPDPSSQAPPRAASIDDYADAPVRAQPKSSKPSERRNRLSALAQRLPPLLAPAHFASGDRFELEALCRAQAQALYLGDHVAVCRILSRYKLLLDTRDRGFAAHVLLDGYWEMWLTIFVCRHLRAGMIVVDVGANFGYYTLLMADLVAANGHVFAVEPNPAVAGLLRQSVLLNGFAEQTSVIECAAGAHSAERVVLFSPMGEFKNARIVDTPQPTEANEGTFSKVSQKTIDEIVADAPRVDFLKIDAEGAEELIIEGMDRCISLHKPSFVLEFNAARCKHPDIMLRRLLAHYKTVSYLDFDSRLVPITEAELIAQRRGQDWLLFFDHDTAVA